MFVAQAAGRTISDWMVSKLTIIILSFRLGTSKEKIYIDPHGYLYIYI